MKTALVLALFLVATGCTRSSDIVLADGKPGKLIKAPGMLLTIHDAYARAGRECPNGFVVMNEAGEAHPYSFAYGSGSEGGDRSVGYPDFVASSHPIPRRSIIVRCR